MARTSTHAKRYALGFDIGGGKILAELYEIQGTRLANNHSWREKVQTQKGLKEHVSQVKSLLQKAVDNLPSSGRIATIGIASPGRFAPDGTIRRRSSPHMGNTPNEFDNVNLQDRYSAVLPEALKNVPLTVMNDGNAMLAGFIDTIKNTPHTKNTLQDQHGSAFNKHALFGKYTALLGFGSGIGHAIVSMDTKGNYQFVTDGHASKLRVSVDLEDWPIIEHILNQKPAFLICEDNTVCAEDLFKLSNICNFCGVDDRSQLNPEIPSVAKGLALAGKYMARTIALIRSGENQDVEPQNGWSAADKAEAARTSIYLIGGGLSEHESGADDVLLNAAAEELKKLNIQDIRLVQMPDGNLAARSAATMALPLLKSHHSVEKYGRQ